MQIRYSHKVNNTEKKALLYSTPTPPQKKMYVNKESVRCRAHTRIPVSMYMTAVTVGGNFRV